MFKNYLKTAWRNIKQRPIFSIVNIMGLAIGLAACIMIGLWVQHHLSYDRFHKKNNSTYRLVSHITYPGGTYNLKRSAIPLAEALNNKYSKIKATVRVSPSSSRVIKTKNQLINQKDYIVADPGFFKMFTFPLLEGNKEDLLRQPRSVVLTKSTAKKYFPSGGAVGQTLTIEGDLKTVTGVIADPPRNSSLKFSMVETSQGNGGNWQSMNKTWRRNPVVSYVQLNSDSETDRLESSISQLQNNRLNKLGAKNYSADIYLQPLTGIHLGQGVPYNFESELNVTYVWLFIALALFILLLAAINYTNLATARSTERAREVGIRKTLGANRWGLARQFLGEAALTCLISLLLALTIAQVALPVFNSVAGVHLKIAQLAGWVPISILISLVLLLIVGSSWYPALLLSGFSPRSIFQSESTGHGGQSMRKSLVVFQFTVAVILIISTVVIFQQLNYMRSASLGFDKKNVLVINNLDKLTKLTKSQKNRLSSLNSGKKKLARSKISETHKTRLLLLRNQIQALPDVQNASLTYSVPTEGLMQTGFEGTDAERNIKHQLGYTFADEKYLKTLGISLFTGRNFSNQRNISNAIILNRAAADIYFTEEKPIGKHISMGGRKKLEVVGVIDNFHFQSLHHQYKPMALFYNDGYTNVQQMAVKLSGGRISQALSQMKQTWQKFVPDVPFTYNFLNRQVAEQYKSEQQTGYIFAGFTILAIFVACLGLFGLTTYATQRRVKEIGIRKALGASVSSIVSLLSKDFLKLVIIGFSIAVPIAWYIMNLWLEDFAYKTELSPWIFLLAGGLAIIIALGTVSWQSIRAALINPVNSLQEN